MERTWDTAIRAREVAEEAVGEAIQWDLVDWIIPAGRLAVYDAAPLDVVRTIAEAAGGVVETTPGGVLRVRHWFPVAVPQWGRNTPDHILTDTADNLSCRESHRARHRVNRVTVRGWMPSGGHLSVEVDRREDGLNRGRTSFHSGGTAHLLVNHGPETTTQGISASADPLLATTEAKISRGRAEIDVGEDLQEISLTCVHRRGVMPGQIVEIHDALMGRSWRGKVTGVAVDATGPRITTSLEVQRVATRS
jgi:hypothetical protein